MGARPPTAHWRIAVGSYTESYGSFRAQGIGITLIGLSGSGAFHHTDSISLPNPSYLSHSAFHGLLYATAETQDFRAGLVALDCRQIDAPLSVSATLNIEGRLPCHLDIHPQGQWIACACYDTGNVIVTRLSDKGGFGQKPGGGIHMSGRGPHLTRQTKSHPHGTYFTPDGNWLIVPNLGTDELAAWPFESRTGVTGTPLIWRAPPASGPRTIAFSRSGQTIVMVSELTSEVSCLQLQDDGITERSRLSSRDPVNAPGYVENTAAGLRMHPDGVHFGVSNRGDDTISIYRLNSRDCTIERRQTIHSGGKKPRDFGFSPCGRWLVTANQDSDNCVLFEIKFPEFRAVPRNQEIFVGSPSCVCFLPN